MQGQTDTLVRMRDASLSLHAAAPRGLARIELQKAVYLADVLCILYDLLAPVEGHETYKHGPYDRILQNAVDCLAFRGLVKVRGHQQSGAITQCRYSLTADGQRWAVELASAFPERSRTHAAVAANVSRLGWARIVKLTYAEPMFIAARRMGYGQKLDHQSIRGLSSSRFLLDYLTKALGGKSPRPEIVATLFFDFLDRYERDNADV